MQSGKEPTGFRVVGIKREQLLHRNNRLAVLAGVHLGDGILKQRAFLAIADKIPLHHPGGSLFVSFLKDFFVYLHSTTLADHYRAPGGSPRHFSPNVTSLWFLMIFEGRTRYRTAILMPPQLSRVS